MLTESDNAGQFLGSAVSLRALSEQLHCLFVRQC